MKNLFKLHPTQSHLIPQNPTIISSLLYIYIIRYHHVKLGENLLDMTQFDELSDLLFIKTPPHQLAERLHVDEKAKLDHIFLMYGNDIFLDRFNSLETAALFVDLGVYDAAFLSLRDDRVAEYLKSKGYVTQEQIDDLQCALNPLYCDSLTPKQDCLA